MSLCQPQIHWEACLDLCSKYQDDFSFQESCLARSEDWQAVSCLLCESSLQTAPRINVGMTGSTYASKSSKKHTAHSVGSYFLQLLHNLKFSVWEQELCKLLPRARKLTVPQKLELDSTLIHQAGFPPALKASSCAFCDSAPCRHILSTYWHCSFRNAS